MEDQARKLNCGWDFVLHSERVPGEEAVGAGLVALSHRPLHLQLSGHPLEPAIEAVAEPRHVLHVEHPPPEEPPVEREELPQPLRQRRRRAVEGHPADGAAGVEQPRPKQQLREPRAVRAVPAQFDGLMRVVIPSRVEVPEVELPDEPAAAAESQVRQVPAGVGEGEPHLDQLQGVDVGLEAAVPLLRRRQEGVHRRLVNHSGELRVHGHVGVPPDQALDQLEL
ncbi:unnamed protein product [Spirodela intermedia]|uniref:Uncharacterized protein n=2 Tax=Spirodela intermedia TaxID=51605 RepID=A0A7I8L3P9_SPIIN|nr:unnamed protein product [Spirodela intermedia]CAA6667613.1 unnamed protein product [Spirodela intermedia]CAA7404432.1 unnamed protein product [Spirodela intermedia]